MTPQTPQEPVRDGFKALLAMVLGLVALLLGVITLTAPMVASTGPAILTVACAAGAYFAWRSSSPG